MEKKILIVEDEPNIAQTIIFTLEKSGFDVTHGASITDAKNYLVKEEFDLILLDIGLPDGNGFEFCQEIRRTSQVPLFFLTARDEEIDRVMGIELGADDYITKPFSPRELAARIKAIFRRMKSVNEIMDNPNIKIGDFQILEEYYQIFYQEKVLTLSRYEYGILKFLIESKGRVLSRNQIMESVWEEPDMSLERTVDAHIKTIRKKLKSVSQTDLITTHRGLGYSLKV